MAIATLIYDGECGFCTACARWAGAQGIAVASSQELGAAGLASVGLTREQAASAAWFVREDGRVARGHAAIAWTLIAAGGAPRVFGGMLLVPPMSWLARMLYPVAVRHRSRLGWLARILQRHQ